jgi:PKHD-type hydroxylase
MASKIPNNLVPLYVGQKDAFTSAEIDSIIAMGRQKTLNESVLANGNNNSKIRASSNAWLFPDHENIWLFERVKDIIHKLNAENYGYELDAHEPLQFASYDSSRREFYSKHTDCAFSLSSPSTSRKLSITLQLSDDADYKGGELVFHPGSKPIKAPRKKGMLIVFPSFIVHEVRPVTEGTRYSLVTWVHGPLFK